MVIRARYGPKSTEELEASLSKRTLEGLWSTLVTATYESDPEIIAQVLPPPLEMSADPVVRVTMGVVDLGPNMPTIGAGTFAVSASHEGTTGFYPLVMPMSTEAAVVGGRERFGEPKKLAEVGLEQDGDQVTGWFKRMGVTFAQVAGLVGPQIENTPDETRVDFYFKCLPSPGGCGFDGNPLLVYCRRDEQTKEAYEVDGTVILEESPFDPVADLVVRRVRKIEFSKKSSSQFGEVKTVVSPVELAPFLHQRYDDPRSPY